MYDVEDIFSCLKRLRANSKQKILNLITLRNCNKNVVDFETEYVLAIQLKLITHLAISNFQIFNLRNMSHKRNLLVSQKQ